MTISQRLNIATAITGAKIAFVMLSIENFSHSDHKSFSCEFKVSKIRIGPNATANHIVTSLKILTMMRRIRAKVNMRVMANLTPTTKRLSMMALGSFVLFRKFWIWKTLTHKYNSGQETLVSFGNTISKRVLISVFCDVLLFDEGDVSAALRELQILVQRLYVIFLLGPWICNDWVIVSLIFCPFDATYELGNEAAADVTIVLISTIAPMINQLALMSMTQSISFFTINSTIPPGVSVPSNALLMMVYNNNHTMRKFANVLLIFQR